MRSAISRYEFGAPEAPQILGAPSYWRKIYKKGGVDFETIKSLSGDRPELNRLVAAALNHSRSFRKLLFTDPAKALEDGCKGETFCFTSAERQLIFSIVAEPPSGNAKTMQEFARRVGRLTGELDADPDDS